MAGVGASRPPAKRDSPQSGGGASQAEDVRGLRGDQSERSIRSPLESLDQTSEHPRDVGHHGPAGGVKWIWEEARLNLADSMGVLDIDHALEAVGDTSKNLFGDGTPEANAWTNLLRTTILERGWEVFDGFWQQTRSPFSETSPPATAPNELRNYLGNQVSQMNCAERLKDVLSIGSGQIEGAWKNLIARRLNRMEGLCSIMYSKQLNEY